MTETTTISPLRQRMIEDMVSRQLAKGTQIGHIRACRRYAAWLKRSADTATVNEVRAFQLHLMATGTSIQTRNRTMTGLRFLFRVTMRRLHLANAIHHIKEPTRIPQILSAEEAARLISMAGNLQARALLAIGYGAGLRVSKAVKLKAKHIDRSLSVIRVEQGKGRHHCGPRAPSNDAVFGHQLRGPTGYRCGMHCQIGQIRTRSREPESWRCAYGRFENSRRPLPRPSRLRICCELHR